ncbi:hypothetical protein ACFL21_04835 [Patescibacteria group bacterium]
MVKTLESGTDYSSDKNVDLKTKERENFEQQEQQEASDKLTTLQEEPAQNLQEAPVETKTKVDKIVDTLDDNEEGNEMLSEIMKWFKEFMESLKDTFGSLDNLNILEEDKKTEEKKEDTNEDEIEQKYFSDIEINDKDIDRNRRGNMQYPYRTNEKRTYIGDGKYVVTSNSGNFGTYKGKENYDSERCKSQVENLVNNKRRVILTFGTHRQTIANDAKSAIDGTKIVTMNKRLDIWLKQLKRRILH